MESSSQQIPKIYTLKDINKVLASKLFESDLIEAIKSGFVSLDDGHFFSAPIQTLGTSPFPFLEVDNYASQTCVKSGYFKSGKYYVIKVASGGYPMENSGLMQVFSQHSGRLESLLLDDGILTEVRTAAVGALAAKLLAPKVIKSIGIVGTGIQGEVFFFFTENLFTKPSLSLRKLLTDTQLLLSIKQDIN